MIIDVRNLVYEYPDKRALDNISFSVESGTITALVGPNGAGKTTLLRCIAALEDAYSGEIIVDGLNVEDAPRQTHQRLGYLSDFFGLDNELTVQQNLIFAARLHQLSEEETKKNIQWVADILKLGDMAKKAGTLSRGWRQRLGIAQAIIHKPLLVLLDEPASGLDPEARIELSHLFRTLKNQGMTLIVSSHILAELEDYCTDMLILRAGKIVEYKKSLDNLSRIVQAEILNNEDEIRAVLKTFDAISNVEFRKGVTYFSFSGDEPAQRALLKNLVSAGLDITSLTWPESSLQDIYMSFAQGTQKG